MLKHKNYLFIIFFILLITILPFTIHNSGDIYESQEINQNSVGYYQSTTCNISLSEVYFSNLGNERTIKYNANNYAGIECFGKVTGLDVVNNIYIVSIGTNSSLTFVIQIFVWGLLIKFIKKGPAFRKLTNPWLLILLPVLFTLQQLSEKRFYLQENKYFSESLNLNNYYLLTILFIFYLFFIYLSENTQNRIPYFINYLPFSFIFVGTFNGFNLNIYALILTFYGAFFLFNGGLRTTFNKVYLVLSFFWLLSERDIVTYFDTDKIRGLINSSNNYPSFLFWIILFGLILNGSYFFIKNSQIDFNLIKINLLISGSLMMVFGLLGATSSLFNFFNFLFFGQNKRGIQTLDSVAGNTWRGFSASAESSGEFFGFILVFYFLCLFFKKSSFQYLDLLFLPFIFFGLFKSNNMAALLSAVAMILIVIINKFVMDNKKKLYIFALIIVILITVCIFIFGNLGYPYSSLLLYESTLHSNLYEDDTNYQKTIYVTEFFDQEDLGTLFKIREPGKISSTLQLLVDVYEQGFDIPFVPNIVSIISLISIIINRTEMWGIFIAKYSPSPIEVLFGNGPYQFNNYLYSHEVRLDLPDEKLLSLFLPHSSLLDLYVFFGSVGVMIVFSILYKTYSNKHLDRTNIYLLSYLIINLLKSDSILYMNSLMLILITFGALYRKIDSKYD